MDRQPVVVVGASSGGLFAASLLAREGVPVLLFEQATRLAPSERTLIVTPELQRVLGFLPASAVLHRVHTLELHAHGSSVQVRLQEPDLVVERGGLLRLLAQRAEEAGAALHYGHRFEGFASGPSGTELLFRRCGDGRQSAVPARAVIAADGVYSDVARHLGRQRHPTVSVLQARMELSPKDDPAVAKVWFSPRETRYFFWQVAESDRHAVVGVVVDDPRKARSTLDAFLERRGWRALGYQAAVVPLYRRGWAPLACVGQLPVLFVGDAAGQVKVTTVGGTVSGLRGGSAAARALLRGTDYRRELRPLTRELGLHWWLRQVMCRLTEHEYELLLRPLRGGAGRLLQVYNRDRLAEALWSILATAPGVLLLAGRALLRGAAWS